ncbi:LOW QUALITY PROTEIN: hypothetical protein N665_0308s0009 [Sinapis alba]|nr:LOW QUALITY PROTEIN: hypothetical protein N665_0308s0009 [Sinapis alba]
MAKSSGKTKFTLKLVVDEERNKVVFAEACRDFVDVLFSLLTLPMGTIVRLLENHRTFEPFPVGCFSNLYKSVVDMGTDDFETEAGKQMLLYPRSLWKKHCKRLKLNLHYTVGNVLYGCSSFLSCKICSCFYSSRCRCGKLMIEKISYEGKSVDDDIQDGVFVRGRSSFIITDDLKVAVRSTDLVLRNLKSVGCGDFSKVVERLVVVGFDEVCYSLLHVLETSSASILDALFLSYVVILTDTFLNKQSPKRVMKTCNTPSVFMEQVIEAGPEEVITFSAIVRKHDMKVLYVECNEDFVDLLFTFLAVPLEAVLNISGDSSTFGGLGNLFKRFKDFRPKEASTFTAVYPSYYYKCQKQLLGLVIEQPLVLIDSKSRATIGSGFVKRRTKFTVSDDLIITPMNSSSALCILKKLENKAEDIQVQEISIGKTQAASLLRASLMTSSALNAALWNSTSKKPKQET